MDQIKLFSVVGEGLSAGGTTRRCCVHRVPGRGSCEQWWGRGIIYGNLQHIHVYEHIKMLIHIMGSNVLQTSVGVYANHIVYIFPFNISWSLASVKTVQ